jgi:hypothetical protein
MYQKFLNNMNTVGVNTFPNKQQIYRKFPGVGVSVIWTTDEFSGSYLVDGFIIGLSGVTSTVSAVLRVGDLETLAIRFEIPLLLACDSNNMFRSFIVFRSLPKYIPANSFVELAVTQMSAPTEVEFLLCFSDANRDAPTFGKDMKSTILNLNGAAAYSVFSAQEKVVIHGTSFSSTNNVIGRPAFIGTREGSADNYDTAEVLTMVTGNSARVNYSNGGAFSISGRIMVKKPQREAEVFGTTGVTGLLEIFWSK